MVKKQAQFQILQVLVDSYWLTSIDPKNLSEDLIDEQNAIFEHLLYNMDYDCESDEEMSSYMLRATHSESASYTLKIIDHECDGEYNALITLENVHSRVQNTPTDHLMDAINENDDACTADVILQTVIYEDIIFG